MNVPNNTDREIIGLLQRDGAPDRDVITIGTGFGFHEQGALTFLNEDAAVGTGILKGERHQLPEQVANLDFYGDRMCDLENGRHIDGHAFCWSTRVDGCCRNRRCDCLRGEQLAIVLLQVLQLGSRAPRGVTAIGLVHEPLRADSVVPSLPDSCTEFVGEGFLLQIRGLVRIADRVVQQRRRLVEVRFHALDLG